MVMQTKKEQIKEIEYQIKMIHNLKKWMRNLIAASSVFIALAYWIFGIQEKASLHIFGIGSIVMAVVCVIICAMIGLVIKCGKKNVDKIIYLVNK